MIKLKLTLSVIFIALIYSVNAQSVSFKAKAPAAVELGERFQLVYSLNAKGDNFTAPNFIGFDILSGPSVGSSRSISIVNGKTTQSFQYTYTYVLAPNKKGEFTIPPAQVKVDGKSYKSNSVKIKVVGSDRKVDNSKGQEAKTDFFIRTFASKKEVYKGEPVIVEIKLFTKHQFQFQDFTEPSFDGFWKEEITNINQNAKREAYNDKVYNSHLIKKMLLFPQKSGELVIDEATLKAAVRTYVTRKARNRTERMFYGNQIREARDITKTVKSNKIKIKVKDLPLNSKPNDFSGVVGEFNLKSEINKTNVNVNDAINLKIEIRGSGNIDLLDIDKPNFPPDFEVYDPKISQNSNNSDYGVFGAKSFEFLIIPRREGVFIINPVSFTYFDIKKDKYITLKSDSFKIVVGEGENTNSQSRTIVDKQNKVHHLNDDIRFIKTDFGKSYKKNSHFFNSLAYKLIIGISTLFAIAFIVFMKKRKKELGNIGKQRNKKANKLARKRLKKANSLMNLGDEKEFYIEISQALFGYISDKFNLQNIELSIDNVGEKLAEYNVNEEIIVELKAVLNDAEFAKFTPDSLEINMDELYNKSIEIISKIEKSLK